MTNVITFPGTRRGRIESRTDNLVEAFWMAAFLLRDREELVFDIASGGVVIGDERGPDPTVFGLEPVITFAGMPRSIDAIVDMATTIDAGTPLPAHMLVFFALWNAPHDGDAVLTYGDAVEMLDGALSNIDEEKERYFKKRGGAS